MSWPSVTFWIMLLAVWLYALVRGGLWERIVAHLLLTAAVATVMVRSPWAVRYSGVEAGVLVIDAALLVCLLIVARHAGRTWPIILAALQAVTLLGHLGKHLSPELWRLGYAIMITAPAYPGLALLALGTLRHDRTSRQARGGSSSRPSSRQDLREIQSGRPMD